MITSTIATTIALVRHETMAPLLDPDGRRHRDHLLPGADHGVGRTHQPRLLSWLVALAAIAVALVSDWASTGHVAADFGIVSVLIASFAAIAVALALLSRSVLLSPLNFEIQS